MEGTQFLNFAWTIWQWRFECWDQRTIDSIIKFGRDVKIRPIHEEEVSNMWVGSLTLKAQTPQNGQTHSNNLSVTAEELFECVWPFYEVGA